MTLPDKYYVPVITAVWMIVLPLVLAFLAGAGADTVFNGLATFFGTLFHVYGGPSLMLGIALLVWTGWRVLRKGNRKPVGHRTDA